MRLLKSGELKMADLDGYSNEALLHVCKQLQFSNLSKYAHYLVWLVTAPTQLQHCQHSTVT